MFKELLLVFVSVASLFGEGDALGSSCGGRELGHSAQRDYWLSNLKHEESASFNQNPGSYKVFRNVKDYGAKGDGVADDSGAINNAISDGNRCGPGCGSSTISPAIVYFPAGRYRITRPLLQFYFTQFIGDAHNLPILEMDPSFSGGIGLIDSDEYLNGPNEVWTNQNNFYRQIRNFIIDLTKSPANKRSIGIHWQVAQATSVTNVHFKMVHGNSQHYGLWMENGSGGFMSDLTFDGGAFGLWVGNQQFTSRNMTITNADTAIYMNWNWGWTFKGIQIENCKTGIDMKADGKMGVGSLLLMDSVIANTDVGVKTATSATTKPAGAGALILDNVEFRNVRSGVQHTSGQELLQGALGVSRKVASWGQGRVYTNGGGNYHQGDLPAPNKPNELLDSDGNFFERSKPMYLDVALSDFISVKSEGAKGDGRTDDTHAIQQAISKYAGCKVIYFPAGDYVVTDTVYVPPGSRIVGEIWSVLLAKGQNFHDMNNPKVMLEVGKPGEQGVAEISEMLFSTEGPVAGAILVQINMRDPNGQKGAVGLWDCHFRVGGAKGTDLQSGNCGKGTHLKPECDGAYMMLHIASTGSAYIENLWAWVSDHDLDGPTQISIYNGRGINIETKNGPVWMYGTASEHSVLYQYNIAEAKNIIMAMIQTETPYYQSYPPAPQPFKPEAKYHDPDFSKCAANSKTCPMAWGLRLVNSENVFVYGAGLYNFFQDYSQDCLKDEHCQDYMLSLENSSRNVHIYNLNTKASDVMVRVNGADKAKQADNRASFCSTIASFSQ